MAFRMFVDDERDAPRGWTKVETIKSVLYNITCHGVDELSLDFDPGYIRPTRMGIPNESFYAIVLFLLMCRPEFLPKKVWLHSSNTHLVGLAYQELKDIGLEVHIGFPPDYEDASSTMRD